MPYTILPSDIKHPNTFSMITGNTLTVKDLEAINQSIRLLLTTAKGELYGDPNFGCNLYSYLYDYEGSALYELIKEDIVTVLTSQDTRVSLTTEDITIHEGEGSTISILITYKINYSNYLGEYNLLVSKRKDDPIEIQ